MKIPSTASIGLDLGAGKCCVASVRAGAVTVLPNAHGDKTTPSFVAFTDSRSLVGSDARDQAALNATNTVYGVKTVLGRRFNKNQKKESLYSNCDNQKPPKLSRLDDAVSRALLPYLHVFPTTEDGSPVFKVKYRNENKGLRLEEITALLISKMKSGAEDHFGSTVTNAVISVPVNFSNAQRHATLDAACIAGLKEVTLVNSTTAAATAYWDQHPRKEDCIAVIDFGASSLSLAVINLNDGVVKVQAAIGDSTIGGNFIDVCVVNAVIKRFEDKHKQTFIESPRAFLRLRSAAEKLKHNLTLLTASVLQIDSMSDNIDFTCPFTRKEMEDACRDQFANLSNALHRLVQSDGWQNVRTVVLVGGSTRIPAVERLIAKTLGKPLDHSLNKDEAVACGAALRAAELCCSTPREVEEVLSRCVWYKEGSKSKEIINFGVRIPGNFSLQTSNDIWKILTTTGINVYENVPVCVGEGYDTFKLKRIRSKQIGLSPKSGQILFKVDESGVFHIELISNQDARGVPTLGLSSDTKGMQACMNRHKIFLEDERKLKEDENAMNDLETFCIEQRKMLEDKSGSDSATLKLCESILLWLENTPKATAQNCAQKKFELEKNIRGEINDVAQLPAPNDDELSQCGTLACTNVRPNDQPLGQSITEFLEVKTVTRYSAPHTEPAHVPRHIQAPLSKYPRDQSKTKDKQFREKSKPSSIYRQGRCTTLNSVHHRKEMSDDESDTDTSHNKKKLGLRDHIALFFFLVMWIPRWLLKKLRICAWVKTLLHFFFRLISGPIRILFNRK
ncbi:heat shock 70 kDa protein IV-like [Hyalella azteca]|uniref:Heat shock 70 kDa protein IV-like n=1 Tax=Hyalella azteca TaxID=294128 RepID=A0A979FPZ8_HYAAZ|nr:heat shock 70 kDa protein IV-like [Hyalella azteca]